MLEFHPLQLEDLPKLRDFFAYSGSRICDTHPRHRVYVAGHVPHRVGYLRRLAVL